MTTRPSAFLLVAVAVLAIALTAGGAGAAPNKASPCVQTRPAFAATTEAVVTVRRDLSGRIYYGCAFRGGRIRKIGVFDGEDGVIRVRLSGRYVGYEHAVCDRAGRCFGAIFVRDLLRPRARRVATIPAEAGSAQDLEVFPDGSVAWIRGVGDGDIEVVKADANGVEVLERSRSVAPFSLAASGRTLYWTSGSQPRSFSLTLRGAAAG